jgi:hypothetical protein
MTHRRILEGIRVLDLTNVLSGPFASLHLALLGASTTPRYWVVWGTARRNWPS